jgi:hypothetical protein
MGRVLLNLFFGTILFGLHLHSHYTLFKTLTCFLEKTGHHISAVLNLLLVLSLLPCVAMRHVTSIFIPQKWRDKDEDGYIKYETEYINLASHKRLIFNNCGSPKFTELSMQAMAISYWSHTSSTLTAPVSRWDCSRLWYKSLWDGLQLLESTNWWGEYQFCW